MRDLLSGATGQRLIFSEQEKLLKDLSQTYYSSNRLEEGLPYFAQLVEDSPRCGSRPRRCCGFKRD